MHHKELLKESEKEFLKELKKNEEFPQKTSEDNHVETRKGISQ